MEPARAPGGRTGPPPGGLGDLGRLGGLLGEADAADGTAGRSGTTVPRPRRAPLSESRPHPTGGGVVGTYVHPYDPFLQPYPSSIPAMRPAQDVPAGQSATPIFDALYAEYSRSFRTLPGDRSGEEEVPFRAFGTTTSTGLYGSGSAGGYAGQAYGHGSGNGLGYRQTAAYQPLWTAHQHHGPAALPPGPRRGF